MSSILEIRKALNISQAEMAERLDIHQSTVSRFERGEIQADKRTLLAALTLLRQSHEQTGA